MKRIISYTICGIVLATTLNSCHIYKKYERPEVDVQGLFRDTVSVTDTLAADSLNIGNLPWTEIFTDPILQGLIRQGLENNSDLQSAMLQWKLRKPASVLPSWHFFRRSIWLRKEA